MEFKVDSDHVTVPLNGEVISFTEKSFIMIPKDIASLRIVYGTAVLDPGAFGAFQSLKRLSFDHCRIACIPPNAFFNLTQLKTLWLRDNQVR